jgi:hypothetical protein
MSCGTASDTGFWMPVHNTLSAYATKSLRIAAFSNLDHRPIF